MVAKFKDRAKHPYPFGFSKVSELAADERRVERDNNRGDEIDRLNDIIADQKREIERLMKLVEKMPTKPKPSRAKKSNRGRGSAADVETVNGVKYFSIAYVAQLKGIHVSNVSRQMNDEDSGIKPKTIGGAKYISEPQSENIKRRKR